MKLDNIKFQYKVYSVTIILIIFFLISNIASQYNLRQISNNIDELKQRNQFLQSTLVLFVDIEKLKRLIFEYVSSADEDFQKPIDDLFDKVSSFKYTGKFSNNEFSLIYEKLLMNINNYKDSYTIAKGQIPYNLELRNNLRENAKELEDKVKILQKKLVSKDVLLYLTIISKNFLEAENNIIRYIESDDITYVNKALSAINDSNENLEELLKEKSITTENKNDIKDSVEIFNKNLKQIIEHYRTYSMLTKVLMPGDAYEIQFYAQKLQSKTFDEIENVKNQIQEYSQLNIQRNLISSIVFTILMILSLILIIKILQSPLKKLTKMFEKLSNGEENVLIPEYKHDDEIGKLIESAVSYKQANKKTKELLKQTQDYKDNLEIKVQEEIEARREREKALIQQAKLASMGEMIGAIAHQWRQPLNELSIRIQKLKYYYKKDKIDEEYVNTFVEKNIKTINFMSRTIDDFRNFFRIDKVKKEFNLKEAIEEVLSIQGAQLKNHNIEVQLEGESFFYNGFRSEFQQVIINIISNAKDAFIQNEIKNPKIKIILKDMNVLIQDNAGGILKSVLDRIFEPYFTTKQQGEGTGMGLYMSKMIIEDNMHGHILATNNADGALITIKLG